jgi:hypothetical protein
MSITSMPTLKLEENSLPQAQKSASHLERVTKASPCRHCGKGDWCYRLGAFDVCNRQASPATGWIETDKKDKRVGLSTHSPPFPNQFARLKLGIGTTQPVTVHLWCG